MEKLAWRYARPRGGLLTTMAVCGVMAAEPLMSQETARSQLSLPDRGHLGLAAAFNGMQAFAEDGTWTAPGQGLGRQGGHVLALLCGAGGGGAGGQQTAQSDNQGSGGGGGGSVLATVPVTPGATYVITIGRGGEPGIGLYEEGQAGTATTLTSSSGVELARADAGGGGTYDEANFPVPGLGGAGFVIGDGGLIYRGSNGPRFGGELDQLCLTFAPDERGGGGRGGVFPQPPFEPSPGLRGENGWVLLIW
jgi:hypothetical protein